MTEIIITFINLWDLSFYPSSSNAFWMVPSLMSQALFVEQNYQHYWMLTYPIIVQSYIWASCFPPVAVCVLLEADGILLVLL